jgi:parallel beta-helix repeat protein
MKHRWLTRAVALGTTGTAAAFLFAGVASAAQPTTVYVSHSGKSCAKPQFRSIQKAVKTVAKGGTVIVCKGVYNEDVVVGKPVTLIGKGAVVNPSSPVNQTNSPLYAQVGNNGFTIASPWVAVRGFTVTGATGDGIFSYANHSKITGNWSSGNGSTGVSLNGSSWSVVAGNTTNNNTGGGITLTDDAGGIIPGATASHDWVVGNTAKNNPLGCGVILADHLGSTVPGAKGIFANVVAGNLLVHNGDNSTTPEGAGAGVVLASPVPGGSVWDNLVTKNTIRESGLAGVTIHSHVPGQHFGGNAIIGNNIGTNNVTGDFGDALTTGVFVGSVDPLVITVKGNLIHDNHYGIFTAGTVAVNGKNLNTFVRVTKRFGNVSPYAG